MYVVSGYARNYIHPLFYMFAQILLFLPLKTRATPLFDYSIPAEMADAIQPGVLVIVPLRARFMPGIVISLTRMPSVPHTRPIHSILETEPALSQTHLDLARWLARETLTPLHLCVKTMLPPGLRPQAYLKFTAQVRRIPPNAQKEGNDLLPKPARQMLATLIARGPLKDSQLRPLLKGVNMRRARQILKKHGFIKVERLMRLPRPLPQTVQLARLAAPRAKWDTALKRVRRLDLYHHILSLLESEKDPVPLTVIYAETGAKINHLKQLEKYGLVAFSREEVLRDPLADQIFTSDTPPPLIPGQQAVWNELLCQLAPERKTRPPILLLGVTGSGKTEIYMRATAEVLRQGQQALILVPEISLTPQTVRRFAVRFTGDVGLWHSGMSAGARYDTWRRVRNGDLRVIVGARSALFAPFPNLGLIVLDEEEDHSYKQSRAPYFHTREVATELARMTGAQLILGSATPSLDSYARALNGQYRLLHLPDRVIGHQQRLTDWQKQLHIPTNCYQPTDTATPNARTIALPPVQIVDMRAELKTGNRTVFSVALQEAVDVALRRREQIILFLNRRGTATYIFCRDCGWVAECSRCDIPMTYHAGLSQVLCHRCGLKKRMPRLCPVCESPRVRAFGLGTAGLEERVRDRWPKANLVRWDKDTARSHATHSALMGRFVRGDADILVGTQMVARGLDIPKVTVVGVVSADTALNLPDFRAAERAFQLLAQVAGRAGRGILGGKVIIQTYHPTHYAVRRAAAHDFVGFAKRELTFRQQAGYPPAIRLARLVFSHSNHDKAQAAAESLAETIRDALSAMGLPLTDLIGPAPAFFARVRSRYRWHLLVRSVDPAIFLRNLDLPPGWSVDIDPLDVL